MRFSFQRLLKFGIALYIICICTAIYQLSIDGQLSSYSGPLIVVDENTLPTDNPLPIKSAEFPGDNFECEDDDDSAHHFTDKFYAVPESSANLILLSHSSYLAKQQEITTPPPKS